MGGCTTHSPSFAILLVFLWWLMVVVGGNAQSRLQSWQSVAFSSGVLNRIKPVVPVAGVRVFRGYQLGNPYPYPTATRDIYPRVSRTRGIP